MEYKIEVALSADELSELVTDHINNGGWALSGGLCTSTKFIVSAEGWLIAGKEEIHYAQALWRD